MWVFIYLFFTLVSRRHYVNILDDVVFNLDAFGQLQKKSPKKTVLELVPYEPLKERISKRIKPPVFIIIASNVKICCFF